MSNPNYQQVPQYDQYGNSQAPQGQPVGQTSGQYGNPSGYPPSNVAYGQPYQYPSGQAEPLHAPEVDGKPNRPPTWTREEVSDQMKFVRKVYSILACQLSMTCAFIALVQTSPSVNDFASRNFALAICAAVGAIVSAIVLICCFRRQSPHNYILLFIFTACETYMVGGLTARYDQKLVILAGLVTALVVIALTIYAMRTKTSIEFFYAITFVIYIAMIPLWIIGLFMHVKALHIVYCALGLLFYSVFLIIDTMQICKGKSIGGYALDMDEYIIGAMMLYIDIIMIFVYILRLLGAANNN